MNLCASLLLLLTVQAIPNATVVDRALAQLEISLDGQTITVRGVAPDDFRICVAPPHGHFGLTRCFTAGAIRRGEVRER